jgi:hypothetical protein
MVYIVRDILDIDGDLDGDLVGGVLDIDVGGVLDIDGILVFGFAWPLVLGCA